MPPRGEAEDELPQALALARVQRRGRLVEQQHRRVGEQADRDVHPLAVAARERAELVARAVAQAGLLEHPRRPRPRGRRPSPAARTAAGSRRPRASRRPPPAAGTQPTSRGGRETSPASAFWSPPRIDSSVVLPAPLGPMMATSSPGRGLEADVAQGDAVAEALGDAAQRAERRATVRPCALRRSAVSVPAGHPAAAPVQPRPRSPPGSRGPPRLEHQVAAQVDDRLAHDRGDRQREQRAEEARRPRPPTSSAKITSSGLIRSAWPKICGATTWPSICWSATNSSADPERGQRILEQRHEHRRQRAEERADERDQLHQPEEDPERERVGLAVGEDPQHAEEPQRDAGAACPSPR